MNRILLALSLAFACAAPVAAQEADLPIQRALLARPRAAGGSFGTANANCPQATRDTVWVGHSSSGPGGTFLGVGVGGVWDYDTGASGTDSTQGWTSQILAYTSGVTRPANQRLEWAYDYGNMIDMGNTNLWH